MQSTVLKRIPSHRVRWNRNQDNLELLLLRHVMKAIVDNSTISNIDQNLIIEIKWKWRINRRDFLWELIKETFLVSFCFISRIPPDGRESAIFNYEILAALNNIFICNTKRR